VTARLGLIISVYEFTSFEAHAGKTFKMDGRRGRRTTQGIRMRVH
jgi:hypothetical protein